MAASELLADFGLRQDGRKCEELRQINCKLGVYGQADGSSYLEQGNTKILAAVYGPREPRHKGGGESSGVKVNCQFSMAVFSTSERKRRPRGDRKSQEISAHLRQTFEAAIKTELYPRSQIDIYIEVLQSDGGNYCASVNAATLALIDAGIPLKDYVTACTAGYIHDRVLVDVNNQESGGGSELTMAILPKSEEIVLLEMAQRFHVDHLPKVMEAALDGCKQINEILEKVVRRHLISVSASIQDI